MTKKIELILPFIFICFLGIAQKPEELLDKWSSRSPIEKVYLHLDRENYVAGETAWLKAYLSSDWQPDTISTTLYVELLNENSTVLEKKVLPVFVGSANGNIELSDTLSTGNYIIRAYTATMLNHDPDFVYKRGVFVYGKKKKDVDSDPILQNKIQLTFFPEGGNLVGGFNSAIAFKANDAKGLPVTITGKIKNEKGTDLATISTLHDGMGIVELNPAYGEKYYAEITTSGEKFYLPDPVVKGISLSVIPHPQGNFFEIQQRTDDPAFMASYMIGQMQHHVVFRQQFTSGKETLQGVINTQNLNSGVLQVTIFNKEGMPLAERLCFVNNKEYIQEAEIIADTINVNARKRNKISIILKDTVMGNISVSVSDEVYRLHPERSESIITSLLLTSDLKGYINNPSYYFSSDDDSVNTALDLLLMTHGWRRFKWTELSKKAITLQNDKAYITLSGKVNLQGTKKPFSDKQLLLMISGNNKTRSTHFLKTNTDGSFRLDSLVFFDKKQLLFCDVRGKKSQYIDVIMNGDSIYRGFSFPAIATIPYKIFKSETQARWIMDYDAIQKANGKMLEGITIKVQKKSPEQQVDERYTRGAFSGNANKTIDLVNNDEANSYLNIFDYLQSRVNGLQVVADGFDYSLYYRQGPSISALGNIPMVLYLDEVETDASVIASVPANQVALVKVYSNFVAAAGNGAGGVLAVYTKKGDDYVGRSGFANYSIYNGYSITKEFYAPDYSADKATREGGDNRITLDWRPSIFINNVNPKIPITFYNNDRTTKFRVVVEGMTTSGKLISIEKIINPN